MLTTPLSLADQVACMIEALCKIVAREGRRLHVPRPLIVLAWNRVARLASRFLALAQRLGEGPLPPARRRPAAPSRPAAAPAWRTRHIAWMLRLMRAEVASCAGALEHFLTLPEMAELVGAAPQAGHILRPLCRMLGVKTPPWLRLPRRASPALPVPERAEEAQPACAPPGPWPAPADALACDAPDAGAERADEAQAVRAGPGPWPAPADAPLSDLADAGARTSAPKKSG
jgi:hypothetical protein